MKHLLTTTRDSSPWYNFLLFGFVAAALAAPLRSAPPKNLGSLEGETTEDSDTRADCLLYRGECATVGPEATRSAEARAEESRAEEKRTQEAYYKAMDNIGPEAVPILIKRYYEMPATPELRDLHRLIVTATGDALVHFEGNAAYPLGAARRQQALDFLAGLLASPDDGTRARAIIPLKDFTERFTVTEPAVLEGALHLMENDDSGLNTLKSALQIASMLGRDEATAQRVERISRERIKFSGDDKVRREAQDLARQAVKSIRLRANSAH